MSLQNSDRKLIRKWCKVREMDYKSAKKVWKNSDDRKKAKFRIQIIRELAVSEDKTIPTIIAGKET